MTGSSPLPIPWLVTGYTADPSGQFWTLNLRQGVTFSDGTQFNATALKDDIQNQIFANILTSNLDRDIPGATAYIASNHNAANQTLFINSDGMKAVSQYSLQFNLTQADASFISLLGTCSNNGPFSVSPSAIATNGGITFGKGNTWLVTHSAGEGPYILSSYNLATGTMVLTANQNWWGISQLGIKLPFHQITVNVVNSISAEELDLRTGASDGMALPVTNVFDFANRTAWQSAGQLVSTIPGTTLYGPYSSTEFYMFNLNSQIHTASGAIATVQPFQNHLLVEAINEAWNASAFIQGDLNGFGLSTTGVLMQGQIGYQPVPYVYPYNLTAAKQNIVAACKQLGCSPSNPLQIPFVSGNDQPAELAGSLLASSVNSLSAGIVLNYLPLQSGAKISAYLSHQYGIYLYEFGASFSDPVNFFELALTKPGNVATSTDFVNQTVTNLLDQAETTSNITQRAQLYLQIDKVVAETGLYMPVFQQVNVFVSNTDLMINPYNSLWYNDLPPIFAMAPG